MTRKDLPKSAVRGEISYSPADLQHSPNSNTCHQNASTQLLQLTLRGCDDNQTTLDGFDNNQLEEVKARQYKVIYEQSDAHIVCDTSSSKDARAFKDESIKVFKPYGQQKGNMKCQTGHYNEFDNILASKKNVCRSLPTMGKVHNLGLRNKTSKEEANEKQRVTEKHKMKTNEKDRNKANEREIAYVSRLKKERKKANDKQRENADNKQRENADKRQEEKLGLGDEQNGPREKDKGTLNSCQKCLDEKSMMKRKEKEDSNKDVEEEEESIQDDSKAKYEKIRGCLPLEDRPNRGVRKDSETVLLKLPDKETEMDNKERDEIEYREMDSFPLEEETSIKIESDPMNDTVKEKELADEKSITDSAERRNHRVAVESDGCFQSVVENSCDSWNSCNTSTLHDHDCDLESDIEGVRSDSILPKVESDGRDNRADLRIREKKQIGLLNLLSRFLAEYLKNMHIDEVDKSSVTEFVNRFRDSIEQNCCLKLGEGDKSGILLKCEDDGDIKECEDNGDIKECEDHGNIKECEDHGNIKECEDHGNIKECEDHGNIKECEDHDDIKECEDHGNIKECEDHGNIKECEDNGDIKECEDDGDIKECEDDGDIKECEDDGDIKECEDHGDIKECEDDGDINECKDHGDIKECEDHCDIKECEDAGDVNECKDETGEKEKETKNQLDDNKTFIECTDDEEEVKGRVIITTGDDKDIKSKVMETIETPSVADDCGIAVDKQVVTIYICEAVDKVDPIDLDSTKKIDGELDEGKLGVCKPMMDCPTSVDHEDNKDDYVVVKEKVTDMTPKTKEDRCNIVGGVRQIENGDGSNKNVGKSNTDKRSKRKRNKKKQTDIEKLKLEQQMKKELEKFEGLLGQLKSLKETVGSYAKARRSFCKPKSNDKPKGDNPMLPKAKHQECDVFVPKTSQGQRRHRLLQGGGYGRKLSDRNSDSGGSLNESNNSGGNGSDNQGNSSEDSNNNQSNKGNDSDNGQNGRNPNDPGRTGPPPNVPTHRDGRTSISGLNVPEQDFKRYRKKHSDISDEHWEKFLGYLKEKVEERGCPLWDLDPNPVSPCLALCMEHTEELSDDMLDCAVCSTTNAFLKHYANCIIAYMKCDICMQIFSLLCCHVNECTKRKPDFGNNSISCTIPLCFKIRITLTGSDIQCHLKMLWFNIRKRLSRVIGDVAGEPVPEKMVIEKTKLERKSSAERRLSVTNPFLESIPENGVPTITPGSRPGSQIMARKKVSLAFLGEEEEEEEEKPDDDTEKSNDQRDGSTIFGELNVVPDALPCETRPVPSGQKKVRAAYTSLPMGPPQAFERQFTSLENRPVGIKGIGEVQYGDKNQLIKVAQYWDTKQKEYRDNGRLPIHYREEGIILKKFKDMLIIGEVRYQKDFQWIKLSALGNGMSGKCSLATDFQTEAKFCVKEIHISSYEMDEIALWTDLDHPYIVQLYGAIRWGERVFIFMEYIAGGCLTEAINHQKALGQRLSQTTALRYFQQLLQVLIHLQSKNILQEDLKGDNILLHREGNTVCIKVTDFGSARRCPSGQVRKGTKPVGTETQWSPEKAEATGYSFPAELWAAVCVLVHMLSGTPPWIRRFGTFKTLILVIVDHSPPLEDIPRNISESVRDLIERGFTVCPGTRPTPEDLLTHPAFKIHVNNTGGSENYSILGPGLPSMCIEDDLDKDLREIYRNLGGTSPDRKFVQPSQTVEVYPVSRDNNNDSAADTQAGAVGGASDQRGVANNNQNNGAASQTGAMGGDSYQEHGAVGRVSESEGGAYGVGGEISNQDKGGAYTQEETLDHQKVEALGQKRSRLSPTDPSKNMDPTEHLNNYLLDTVTHVIPDILAPNLIEYHPDLVGEEGYQKNQQPEEVGVPSIGSEEALTNMLPRFHMICDPDMIDEGMDSDNEDEDHDMFRNFDLKTELQRLNISTEGEEDKDQDMGEPVIPLADDDEDKKSTTAAVTKKIESTENKKTVRQIKEPIAHHPDVFGSHYDSVNEDDLFGSGKFDSGTQFSSKGESVTPYKTQGYISQDNVSQPHNNPVIHTIIARHIPQRYNPTMPPSNQYQYVIQRNQGQGQIVPQEHVNSEWHHGGHHPGNPNYATQAQSMHYTGPVPEGHSQHEVMRHPLSLSPYLNRPQHRLTNHLGYPAGTPENHTRLPSQYGIPGYPGHGGPYRPVQTSPNTSTSGNTGTYTPTPGHTGTFTPTPGHTGTYTPTFRPRSGSSPEQIQYQPGIVNVQQNYLLPDSRHNPRNYTDFTTISQYRPGQPTGPGNHQGTGELEDHQRLKPWTSPPLQHHSYAGRAGYQQSPEGYSTMGYQNQAPRPGNSSSAPSRLNPYVTRNPNPGGVDPNPYFTDPQREYAEPNDPRRKYVPHQIMISQPYPVHKNAPLQLDVEKAKQGIQVPSTYAQTAPVVSPPKTPKLTSPPYKRASSYIPPKQDRLRTSTSSTSAGSQLEEQERALLEFKYTAHEALSQHDGSNVDWEEEDEEHGLAVAGELDLTGDLSQHDWQSIATTYLDNNETDRRIQVTFRRKGDSKGEGFRMSFARRDVDLSWETIIDEELSRHTNELSAGLDRFCLKFEDGSLVDLNSSLGEEDLVVYVEPADERDWWWVEGSMIMKSSSFQ